MSAVTEIRVPLSSKPFSEDGIGLVDGLTETDCQALLDPDVDSGARSTALDFFSQTARQDLTGTVYLIFPVLCRANRKQLRDAKPRSSWRSQPSRQHPGA